MQVSRVRQVEGVDGEEERCQERESRFSGVPLEQRVDDQDAEAGDEHDRQLGKEDEIGGVPREIERSVADE